MRRNVKPGSLGPEHHPSVQHTHAGVPSDLQKVNLNPFHFSGMKEVAAMLKALVHCLLSWDPAYYLTCNSLISLLAHI